MWYCLFIQDTSRADALSLKLSDDFFQFQLIHPNRDAAIFLRIDKMTGGAHFYFSPGMELIASSNGASQCERPSSDERGKLLAGDEIRVARLYS